MTEIDPVKAMEARMDGYDVMKMDDAAPLGDVFVTATGCMHTITVEHAEQAYFLTLESDMTEPTDEMISQIGTRLSDGVNRNLRAEGLTASSVPVTLSE